MCQESARAATLVVNLYLPANTEKIVLWQYELGQLAQKFYPDYEQADYISLQKELGKTVPKLLELIDATSNKALYEVSWYGKWILGRMIRLNTASPYQNARNRVLKWKKVHHLLGETCFCWIKDHPACVVQGAWQTSCFPALIISMGQIVSFGRKKASC